MAGCYEAIPSEEGIIAIEFAAPGQRARKVISRSNMKPTGRFPSFRMNRMIHWDSPNELNAYRLLESNPAVLAFSEQPCVIRYRLGSEVHRHYPDSLVRTAETNILWEIKTAKDAQRPDVLARTALLAKHLPAKGFQYGVVLAEDLACEPRLKNVRFLLRYGCVQLSFEQKEYARRLLSAANTLHWQDVVAGRYSPFALSHACRLVLEGILYLNLDEPFGSDTVIRLVSGSSLWGARHE